MNASAVLALLLLLTAVGLPLPARADGGGVLPPGWFVAGSAPHQYAARVEEGAGCEQGRVVRLGASAPLPTGTATFMQMFRADLYRGKRVRFSASVRAEDVAGWAGLWMRVDGPSGSRPLSFDNMQDRALAGSTACARHAVVLDVPKEATRIALGVILQGPGAVWMNGVRVEEVGGEVASTDLLERPGLVLPEEPQNLELAGGEAPAAGRVGWVWWNHRQVEGRERVLRDAQGTWRGPRTEVRVAGERVEGSVKGLAASLVVSRKEGATRVEGRWGAHPVAISLQKERLVLRWGAQVRELVPDSRARLGPHCVRYVRTDGGLSPIDELELCGQALQPAPPPAQLVLALLENGFTRALKAGPPQPVAPTTARDPGFR